MPAEQFSAVCVVTGQREAFCENRFDEVEAFPGRKRTGAEGGSFRGNFPDKNCFLRFREENR